MSETKNQTNLPNEDPAPREEKTWTQMLLDDIDRECDFEAARKRTAEREKFLAEGERKKREAAEALKEAPHDPTQNEERTWTQMLLDDMDRVTDWDEIREYRLYLESLPPRPKEK